MAGFAEVLARWVDYTKQLIADRDTARAERDAARAEPLRFPPIFPARF